MANSIYAEARDTLTTVRDLVRFGVSRFNEANLFFGHGTQNAFDEAAYLILHTLNLPIDTLDPFLDARVTPTERDRVLDVLRRRQEERVPAAYLTREAWLGDFRFYVDERVIVPRSFIFELLKEQLSPWIEYPEDVGNVLDMCTGSGCLAIVASYAFPNARIDGVDISGDALDVARKNVDTYGLGERISLIESDLFTALGGRTYDIIISNPPYVNRPSMDVLPAEYQKEPRGALASGDDGLDATRVILRDAAAHLNKDGILVVEIGHNRLAVEEAYPHTEFTWLESEDGNSYVFMLSRAQVAAIA